MSDMKIEEIYKLIEARDDKMRETLKESLESFRKGMISDLSATLAERDKEINKTINKNEFDINQMQKDFVKCEKKNDEFKASIRADIKQLELTSSKIAGMSTFAKFLVTSGLVGFLIVCVQFVNGINTNNHQVNTEKVK